MIFLKSSPQQKNNMKKIFGLLGLLLFSFNIYAQIQEPVKWTYAIENNGSENPTLVIKASIDDHWHVYSQFVGEGGPLPTTFKFTPNPNYQLIKGVLEIPKPITISDEVFEMKVSYFEHTATFKQKINTLTAKDYTVSGTFEYMVCNDKQCLPPEEVAFNFAVKGLPTKAIIASTNLDSTQTINKIDSSANTSTASVSDSTATTATIAAPVKEEGNWSIFFQGFLFGFVALLVPGSIGVSEGELQFKQKRGIKRNTICFINLIFESRRSIQQKV